MLEVPIDYESAHHSGAPLLVAYSFTPFIQSLIKCVFSVRCESGMVLGSGDTSGNNISLGGSDSNQ